MPLHNVRDNRRQNEDISGSDFPKKMQSWSIHITLGNLQGHRFHSWEGSSVVSAYVCFAIHLNVICPLTLAFEQWPLIVSSRECAMQDKAHEIMRRTSNPELAKGAARQTRGKGKGKEERWNRITIIIRHVPLVDVSNWQIHSLELSCSNYPINLIFTVRIDHSVDFSLANW